MATLSGFFGALATILAMVGLYGVISYMVVRRRNEIGVRMALGANRSNILGMVLREAAILLGIGLALAPHWHSLPETPPRRCSTD